MFIVIGDLVKMLEPEREKEREIEGGGEKTGECLSWP